GGAGRRAQGAHQGETRRSLLPAPDPLRRRAAQDPIEQAPALRAPARARCRGRPVVTPAAREGTPSPTGPPYGAGSTGRRRRTARQEDLLNRLVGLFAAEGFAGFTLDDLVERMRC